MQIAPAGPASHNRIAGTSDKTGVGCRPYLLKASSSQEIGMATSRISRFVFAVMSAAAGLPWANAAVASQGPGVGPGTASSFTQLAMAVIVYGTSALVVGVALIGA